MYLIFNFSHFLDSSGVVDQPIAHREQWERRHVRVRGPYVATSLFSNHFLYRATVHLEAKTGEQSWAFISTEVDLAPLKNCYKRGGGKLPQGRPGRSSHGDWVKEIGTCWSFVFVVCDMQDC